MSVKWDHEKNCSTVHAKNKGKKKKTMIPSRPETEPERSPIKSINKQLIKMNSNWTINLLEKNKSKGK